MNGQEDGGEVREIVVDGGGQPGGSGPGAGGGQPGGHAAAPEGGQPGPAGGAAGGEPGGAQPSQLDDAEEFELEPGKKLTRKDLRAGYMMQADYSKKTADLARQREELGELVKFKEWMDNPDVPDAEKVKVIAKSLGVTIPEAQAVVDANAGKPGAGDGLPELDPNDPVGAYIKAMKTELAAVKKELGDFKKFKDDTAREREGAVMQQIDREVKEVQGKYKGISQKRMDIILSLARVNPDKTIMDVADDYFADLEAEAPGTIAKYIQEKEKIAADKGGHPGGAGAPPVTPPAKLKLGDKRVRTGFLETFRKGLKENQGA